MDYTIKPFTRDYLTPAFEIFIDNYKREQESSPLLPSRAINEPEWIFNALKSLAVNPGVAVFKGNQLLAYMVTGFLFPFKGQNAVQVPVFCHGSALTDKKELYQRMYMHLADEWVKNRRHIHIFGHFAHDLILQETLYQLGFGAILAEQLRDFSAIQKTNKADFSEEKDIDKLVDIHIEHMRYYPYAPIFILKETERKAVIADLESYENNRDVFLVYYEHKVPAAYFIIGSLTTDGEGFLLHKTNTTQVKGAYAKPHIRGKGIGKALLQYAINWSQEHGCERLFVEHETANYYGGNFWCGHFSPYLYFSMRYIDNTIC